MASKRYYSKKEVQELVSKEVTKATKGKGYTYSKWATQYLITGALAVILIIIIVTIIATLDY